MRTVHDNFAFLWCQIAILSRRETYKRMVWQRTLQPNEEEICQMGIWNGIVVRRVGEPDADGFVGQRVGDGIGGLG